MAGELGGDCWQLQDTPRIVLADCTYTVKQDVVRMLVGSKGAGCLAKVVL